jgi:hypothetical protein
VFPVRYERRFISQKTAFVTITAVKPSDLSVYLLIPEFCKYDQNTWVPELYPLSESLNNQKTQRFGNWIYIHLQVTGIRHLLSWVARLVTVVSSF